MKPTTSVLMLALTVLGACAGGQTGEGEDCGGRFEGEQREEVLRRFVGSYETPAVRTTSQARCPGDGEPTTLFVTVTPASEDMDASAACIGLTYTPVNVELRTSDGELDSQVFGRLTYGGFIDTDQGDIQLPSPEYPKLLVTGFEPVRTSEPCCSEPPADLALIWAATQPWKTDVFELGFTRPESLAGRTTMLSASISAETPQNACDTLAANFELVNEAGEVAASGDGVLQYEADTVDAEGDASHLIGFAGQATTVDEAKLIGETQLPFELLKLDLYLNGMADHGSINPSSFWFVLGGDDSSASVDLAFRDP